MIRKRLFTLGLTGALCLSLSVPALAAGLENFQKTNAYTAGQFTDVSTDSWYAANVQAAYELGLMTGSSAAAFNPNGNLTVAEAVALACRLHSTYVEDGAAFTGSGPWYQPYVDYAVSAGIITSAAYPDYTATATRAQFAAILAASLPDEALAAINTVEKLPDVDPGASYASAVLKLYNAGVLTGSDAAGTFKPAGTIQRSEVAAIVTRMADKSLRKTFTLVDPALIVPASTRKFDGMLTADDLQGVWYAHRDPATTSSVTSFQVDNEEEWIFSGNEFTYVRHSLNRDTYFHLTGTYTVSAEPYNGDPNICHVTLNVNYGTCYYNDAGEGFQKNELLSNATGTRTFNANLLMPTDCFVYDGSTFNRADGTTVYSAYQDAMGQLGMKGPVVPQQETYDFLVNYAQTEGHKVTFGDYSGQYECYLDLFQTLGTNKDWNYSMYYDPVTGNITLNGSYFSTFGDRYEFSSHADCSVIITPDLATPYTLIYDGSGMVTNIFGDLMLEPSHELATGYVDPATFSKSTQSVEFTEYEGMDEDQLDHNQKNCAVNVRIMLTALEEEILLPNGHSLEGLGFAKF